VSTGPEAPSIIRVAHATKSYHLRQERSNLRGLIPGRFGELTGNDLFRALDDVTFDVRPGEAIGIVGQNGAGKSTLLKVLAGIIEPSSGTAEVRGKVSALIELGAAFEQSLTGRENVYFAAGLLGLSRAETKARFDSIVEFAGLEDFIDMPVKRYSTGMKARLGFAVATCIDPDILIVDEVLSVGDFAFQRKSLKRIREIHETGATLVLVSHSAWMMEQLCTRLLLLEHGALVLDGRPSEVMAAYHGEDHVAETDPSIPAPQFLRFKVDAAAPQPVEIESMWTVPEIIRPYDPIVVAARITVHRPTVGVLVMTFFTSGRAVFAERDLGPSDFLLHEGTWIVTAEIPHIPIATGLYMFRFAILPEDSEDPEQTFENALATAQAEFTIDGPVSARPGLYLDTAWQAQQIESSGPRGEPVTEHVPHRPEPA
jgi:ABC-type polysaccharide/polyol phosphate transport system ATPase subunit